MTFGCAVSRLPKKSNRSNSDLHRRLQAFFAAAFAHFGPLDWWPGETRFEICVGAILTQNTAWTNVEKAIANLKRERLLSVRGMERAGRERLAEAIRPAGYYNQKSERLLKFCRHIMTTHGGSLKRMLSQPLPKLRAELLAFKGIGPETADSMILYAADQPIFVVDAYTRRILSRMGLVDEDVDYDELQDFFHRYLPPDTEHYGEFHAQIVYVGKEFCRKTRPRCETCPVRLT